MRQDTFGQGEREFDTLAIKLASPERIRAWSFGEVVKPETINYRTQRSEKGGLFDEKIFGPEKDHECYCGKYKGIRYKGIICEKCGVEVTRSIVRRERMGHIELSSPVSHIWFLRGIPSRIGLVLGSGTQELERVIYFAGYIITTVHAEERTRLLKELDAEYKSKSKSLKDERSREKLKELHSTTKRDIESIRLGAVLDEATFHRYSLKFGTAFEAGIGAEAIFELFQKVNLEELRDELITALETAGATERVKLQKRLALARALIRSGVRPEWMFLTVLPVIPPALRPMVALTGGRHATSDVNDLYRRVINRNNRLKKLQEIDAPDVILRNEKRILQEAVDALIDNSIRHGSANAGAMNQAQRRPLKSLSDNLKGKQGLLRQNLLGKRVDYSGRSVIVIGPDLALNECGLPKHMALELFRPFVIAELLKQELAYNIRGAGRLIDEGRDEVWAILENIIAGRYVLLNRAPTLHRLGIQAFRPRLIEGNAIQVHPLVCTAFNADFDGDQMAVHVPLSDAAQLEAREIMASDKNLLGPGTGDSIVTPKQDIILGCYWMTKDIEGEPGEGKVFMSPSEAITARDFGHVSFHARIKVLPPAGEKYAAFDGKPFETTVGRLLFNAQLPETYPYLNTATTKKAMGFLVDDLINRYGISKVPPTLDKIKTFGFTYMTVSGITFGIDEVRVPEEKEEIIARAQKQSDTLGGQYEEGLLSADERYRKNIEVWQAAGLEIENVLPGKLAPNGPVNDMLTSGARGSIRNVAQMAGMKGLIQNTAGEIIEFPVLSSAKEGLNPLEYFRSTHGSRKGLADTALNTAKAGYLTRRLFVVAQDAIITELDCKTKGHIVITKESMSGMDIPLEKNIKGRYLAQDIMEKDGSVLFERGHFVTSADAVAISNTGIEAVAVRSPLACESLTGICQKCYGMDLGNNEPIALGEAVGTIAAQAVGEPATQLTMRTFHSGGTAQRGGDITAGLPRVEEVFERRIPKSAAVISHVGGTVTDIATTDDREKVIVITPNIEDRKKRGNESIEYKVPFRRMPIVAVGAEIKKGDLLTDGSADIKELFAEAGEERTKEYIIRETSKIYELQGAAVARKHIEVIVRQMFNRCKITAQGDTTFTVGEVVERSELSRINRELAEAGKEGAEAETLVLGISEVSLTRASFLSAASFQHTTKILINAAVRGSRDHLRGLMENVILGRLIPAGTGFADSPKAEAVRALRRNGSADDVEDE